MKLIKFKQNVCSPCVELEMFMTHELGVEPDETYTLDSGKDEDINKAIEFEIMNTPVLVLVDDNGKEIDRVIGTNREAVYQIVRKRRFTLS